MRLRCCLKLLWQHAEWVTRKLLTLVAQSFDKCRKFQKASVKVTLAYYSDDSDQSIGKELRTQGGAFIYNNVENCLEASLKLGAHFAGGTGG